MVSSVSGLLSTAKRYGGYGANFILGTGSDVVGAQVRAAVQARKATGASLGSSIFTGFSRGVELSNQQVAKTGFLTNTRKAFGALPGEMGAGWKNADVAGKGFFKKYLSKAGGFLKPLSKVMPLAFNALMLLSAIPSMMERTQDEGIFGGIKEGVKTIGKMGMYALGSALGAAFGGIGAFAGVAAAGFAAEAIFGKDYSLKKAEQQEKMNTLLKQQQEQVEQQQEQVADKHIDYQV